MMSELVSNLKQNTEERKQNETKNVWPYNVHVCMCMCMWKGKWHINQDYKH